jgi:hypothetical protein
MAKNDELSEEDYLKKHLGDVDNSSNNNTSIRSLYWEYRTDELQ